MTVNLNIRGYCGPKVVFMEPTTLSDQDLDTVLPSLAEEHCAAMASGELTMIEIEFMDEPDINQRFFRMGTEPDGMVTPIRLAPRESNALPVYVIYRNPTDHPGKFVVRIQFASAGSIQAAAQPLVICETLEEARAAIPPGLYNLGREAGDEPQIYEAWV